MLIVSNKKKYYSVDKVFFATDNIKTGGDILNCFYSSLAPRESLFSRIIPLFTAKTSLDNSQDDILKSFTKTVRYEISRSIKENVLVTFVRSLQMKDFEKEITELQSYYGLFCKQNSRQFIESFFNKNELQKLAEKGALAYSYADTGAFKVYHVYCVDGISSMLLFSFSFMYDKAQETTVDKGSLGRANKYLHFFDMMCLKEDGVRDYDWGGVFNPEKPNGIDKFKLSFGAQPRRVYTTYTGQSFKGKVLVLLSKIKLLFK